MDVLVFDTQARPAALSYDQGSDVLVFDQTQTMVATETETEFLLFDAGVAVRQEVLLPRDFLIVDAPAKPTVLVTAEPNLTDFLVLTTSGLPGPAGHDGQDGQDGAQGPQGPPGGSLVTMAYTHHQDTPALVWDVIHPLEFRPNVTTIDSAGTVVVGDLVYLAGDHIQLIFSAPFGGTAYLS